MDKLKIFISYALADESIAKKLQALITAVGQGCIEPFVSSNDGLEAGDILVDKIHHELLETDSIFILITPNSVNRAWVMYESGFVAGLAAKRARTKGKKAKSQKQVCPVLFQMSDYALKGPLSIYTLFHGDKVEDLEKLLYQVVARVIPQPDRTLIKQFTEKFIIQIAPDLDLLKGPQQPTEVRFINRHEASVIFHKKMVDPNVNTIQIIAYTNEVEAESLNRYTVQGPKTIEVFKRSIFSDYADEQLHNIRQLFSTGAMGEWKKKEQSLKASQHLENSFKNDSSITVREYFYDGPPLKRAYIFNGNEAIFSCYEIHTDAMDGSVFKGMTDCDRVFVTDKNKIGKYLLNELKETIEILRHTSRDWHAEQLLLTFPGLGNTWSKIVHCNPKAVFLDMDGVLYNSLPLYVKAWIKAFRNAGIEISEQDVYWHEGRSSEDTVKLIVESLGISMSLQKIKQIADEKRQLYNQFGKPPCQKGAKELIREIMSSELPVYVVTSSTKPELISELKSDFADMVNDKNVISGRDITHYKPHPEPYLLAYQRAGVSPDEAIVIENAPLGIRSAVSSGAFCIAVNTGILMDQDLKNAGAGLVIKDCTELANNWQKLLRCFTEKNIL